MCRSRGHDMMPELVRHQDIDDEPCPDCYQKIMAVDHDPMVSMRRTAQMMVVPVVNYVVVVISLG